MKATVTNRISKNEGIILVAVIAMVMAMSVLAIALMSINGSEVIANQKQIDRIKAGLLATGAFWETYMNSTSGGTIPTSITQTLDGKTFTATITSSSGGPNGTTLYNSTVSY